MILKVPHLYNSDGDGNVRAIFRNKYYTTRFILFLPPSKTFAFYLRFNIPILGNITSTLFRK